MGAIIGILLCVILGIVIFKQVKSIIETIKAKKQKKDNDSNLVDINNENKEE